MLQEDLDGSLEKVKPDIPCRLTFARRLDPQHEFWGGESQTNRDNKQGC